MINLVINKRCPICKSTSFHRVKRKSWMHLIPQTKHFFCHNCSHKFLSVFDVSDIVERRIDKRVKIKEGISVEIFPSLTDIGPVVDLSKNGLSFDYNPSKRIQKDWARKLNLSRDGNTCRLKNIPFKVRSIFKMESKDADPKKLRKRVGLQFVGLTEKDKSIVQSFINSNKLCEA